MGWLTRMLSPEDPFAPLLPASWLSDAWSVSGGNDSGVNITELNSRSASGVLAATRVISEAAAAYDKQIFQKIPTGKRLAEEHPLFPIINGPPNPQMTNVVFWAGLVSQICLWGNGYARIQRDGANRARALWPMPSSHVRPVRKDGVLLYESTATSDGSIAEISPGDILHFPFLAFDGLQGHSPIRLRRQSLGLNSAAERFGAMLFGRGSRPSGVLETTAELKPEQKANLKASWQEGTSGANAMGVALLPTGVSFKPLTIDPKDAQFLETRKYQLEEVARDFRVPPHMIGILERATHSNAEQLGAEFSTYTMMWWVQLIEQELNRKLFPDPRFYVKLNMDVFLRGDFATRMEGYAQMRNVGVLSADNINNMEGWPLIGEEAGGDVRIVPLNMVSLKQVKAQEDEPLPEPSTDPPAPEEDSTAFDQRERYAMSFRVLFRDATGRTINREKRDVAFVEKTWTPTVTALAEALAVVKGAPELSKETLAFLGEYVGALAIRSAAWTKATANEIAVTEFNRAYTALSGKV